MKYLFQVVLFFRLRQGLWADLFMWWHKRHIEKALSKIDLDVSDIKFIKQ